MQSPERRLNTNAFSNIQVKIGPYCPKNRNSSPVCNLGSINDSSTLQNPLASILDQSDNKCGKSSEWLLYGASTPKGH